MRQVRVCRHPNRTTRIVLDAEGVSSYSVYPLYNPYRLVIDCLKATAAAKPAATTPRPVSLPRVTSVLPAKRLTPSRLDWLSRPFLELPTPFL